MPTAGGKIMNWVQTIQLLVTLFSAAAAILAWIAKLKWSQEYTTAKEAEIKAKDAQIDSLNAQIQFWRSITPPELTKYYESVKEGLQKYIQDLKAQLEEAKKKLVEKERRLTKEKGATIAGKEGVPSFQQMVEIVRKQEKQLEQVSTQPVAPLLSSSVLYMPLAEARARSARLSELLGVQKVQFPTDLKLEGMPISLINPTAGAYSKKGRTPGGSKAR
jgi:Tfp pilus assembly protein FimV